MEIKAKPIGAYGKGCIGCRNNDSDIMITVMSEEKTFTDVFITDKQAKRLADELLMRVSNN